MKYDKYLPLGTIVLLKGGIKKVMITGFCVTQNDAKMHDYTGCLYPEGYMTSSEILVFDHDNIDRIYAIGYSDDEEKEFKKTLDSLLAEKVDGK